MKRKARPYTFEKLARSMARLRDEDIFGNLTIEQVRVLHDIADGPVPEEILKMTVDELAEGLKS